MFKSCFFKLVFKCFFFFQLFSFVFFVWILISLYLALYGMENKHPMVFVFLKAFFAGSRPRWVPCCSFWRLILRHSLEAMVSSHECSFGAKKHTVFERFWGFLGLPDNETPRFLLWGAFLLRFSLAQDQNMQSLLAQLVQAMPGFESSGC